MVAGSTASTIHLHETRRPKTAAERQRAYRQRKRQQRQIALAAILPEATAEGLPSDQLVTPDALPVRPTSPSRPPRYPSRPTSRTSLSPSRYLLPPTSRTSRSHTVT
jgi:hypothetical protein